ncbi:hypothetical protein INS49_004702 [Diaporthe citri]|uniref:uncharacterized protein n=1 Tax=Diaporthe citri TaxID=83186 RepID=UPI001C7EE1E4|nr:uncharacterized protein INS49_004702 [Diaporthe citri]KAG6354684.1 hypothetical protein INS49_004702 [Diaporthe citri]
MADPEFPARKKSKRKRWTVLLDPEEVVVEIMNELQSSRDGIDKKLAKYNDSFMKTQNEKRQQFIEYCTTRVHDLPSSVRSTVATQLLSSEDFAVEMNFSEVHTSSTNSLLTWSCSDASMSDTSWRILLQQHAEDAAAPSPPRAGKLARTTRSTSKGCSPPTPSSNQIAEPSGHPSSIAFSEAGMARDELTEYEEGEKDILSISKVTISKHRRVKAQESLAVPPMHESTWTNERQAPTSRETSTKTSSSRARHWSPEECATLRKLCHGKDGALDQYISRFWQDVSSQIPGRTQRACFMKWMEMKHGPRKRKTAGSSGTRHSGSSKTRWSAEEVQKFAQCCSQPAKARDWARVAAQFPGRTANACYMQYRKLRATNLEVPNGVQSQGRPVFGPEEVRDESQQGEHGNPGGGS